MQFYSLPKQVESQNGRVGQGLFKKIDFEDWLELAVPMRLLPRESALYVKLFGLNKEDPSQRVALGWFALNLFSSKRELVQGIKLCPLWGADVDEMSGPPCCSDSPSAPLMLMQFTEFDNIVFFPKVSKLLFAFISENNYETNMISNLFLFEVNLFVCN